MSDSEEESYKYFVGDKNSDDEQNISEESLQHPDEFRYDDEEDQENENYLGKTEESDCLWKKPSKFKPTKRKRGSSDSDDEKLVTPHTKLTASLDSSRKRIRSSLQESVSDEEDETEKEEYEKFIKENMDGKLAVNPMTAAIYTMAPSPVVAFLMPFHFSGRTESMRKVTKKAKIEFKQLRQMILKFITLDTAALHFFYYIVRTHIMQVHEQRMKEARHGKDSVEDETTQVRLRRWKFTALAGVLMYYLSHMKHLTIEEAIEYEYQQYQKQIVYGTFESVLKATTLHQSY